MVDASNDITVDLTATQESSLNPFNGPRLVSLWRVVASLVLAVVSQGPVAAIRVRVVAIPAQVVARLREWAVRGLASVAAVVPMAVIEALVAPALVFLAQPMIPIPALVAGLAKRAVLSISRYRKLPSSKRASNVPPLGGLWK